MSTSRGSSEEDQEMHQLNREGKEKVGNDIEEEVDEQDEPSTEHGGESDENDDVTLPGGPTNIIPVTMKFKNLFFTVKMRKSKNPFQKRIKKTLLKDLHGELRPGEVTAIMGPSGAGKTTLLNLLAGRVQSGTTKGTLTVNDIDRHLISDRRWSRLCSYIMQDDVMFPSLTPRETLWFAAQLKLPITERNKRAKVTALINELGLEKCQKTKVGDPGHRGISGGQRKRVSIGMEMITDPSILFLDEPTSGLDSSTSYSLIEKLQRLASTGRTIMMTIHQPSTDIFFKFDNLMLLADGHMVYNGPTKDVVSYFEKLGYKCPQYTNPAEFVMNLVKADSYITSKEEGEARLKHLISAYRTEHNLPELTEDGNEYADPSLNEDDSHHHRSKARELLKKRPHLHHHHDDIAKIPVTKGPNFLYRWGLLLLRGFLIQVRDPMLLPSRIVQSLFLSLLVGLLYLRIDNDQASIRDRQGSLFFVIMALTMGPMFSCLSAFQAERVIFIREHSTGSYTTLTYYLAKVLADFPFLTVMPVIQGIISYWMVGYQAQPDKFFIYLAACIVVSMVAHALGLVVSAGAPNVQISMALAPLAMIPLMLLGGFFISDDAIPKYIMWLKYFSPFKYGFQIIARGEFEGLTFSCTGDPSKCTLTGEEVLADLSLDNNEGTFWASFLFLFMQYFFFHVIAYVLLRITAGRQKA